jgi:hypothetical protein
MAIWHPVPKGAKNFFVTNLEIKGTGDPSLTEKDQAQKSCWKGKYQYTNRGQSRKTLACTSGNLQQEQQ